jgi:hypothetical protein
MAQTETARRCSCGAAARSVCSRFWTCANGHVHLVRLAASAAPPRPTPSAPVAEAALGPAPRMPTPRERRRFRRLVRRVTKQLLQQVDERTEAKRAAIRRSRT